MRNFLETVASKKKLISAVTVVIVAVAFVLVQKPVEDEIEEVQNYDTDTDA